MKDENEEVMEEELEEAEVAEPEVEDDNSDDVTETETEEAEEEVETAEDESEEEPEDPEPVEPEPVKPTVPKKQEKKKTLPKKEPVQSKPQKKEEDERKFTQADVDRIVQKKLAKSLPPKEEMEQYKKWRESQQTLEEKMSVLRVENTRLNEENENLLRENMVVKAGVNSDAVEFVLFKVGKMDGDFEDNLNGYLKKNPKYIMPKTTVVEAAEHKPKAKLAITKKDLDAMDYASRAKYKEEHPEEYAKAMGR